MKRTVEISPLCAKQLGVVHESGLFAFGKDGVIKEHGKFAGMRLRYNDALVKFYADIPEDEVFLKGHFGNHFGVKNDGEFFITAIL